MMPPAATVGGNFGGVAKLVDAQQGLWFDKDNAGTLCEVRPKLVRSCVLTCRFDTCLHPRKDFFTWF